MYIFNRTNILIMPLEYNSVCEPPYRSDINDYREAVVMYDEVDINNKSKNK